MDTKRKKCPDKKILNPKTNRCISITSKLGKKIINNAAKIIQRNMKNYLNLFINRVSANIYDRIIYYKKLIKNLNFKNESYCINLYKYDKENNPIFKIGDNIILNKRIGSKSAHANVYLASFKDKNKKLFKFAVKKIDINYKTLIEKEIIELLNNSVINNKCPHFPISYGNIYCNLNTKNYFMFISELASGDLNIFMNNFKTNNLLLGNAFTQAIISIMFFYKETNKYHCDTHNGNFLYHKIKEGGYFHYNFFGKDYYLKNLGYLWIIWDFEQAVPLTSKLSNHNDRLYISYDFYSLLLNFIVFDNYRNIYKKLFISSEISFKNYDRTKLNIYLNYIIEYLCELGYISKTINKTDIIINKKPYIIDYI